MLIDQLSLPQFFKIQPPIYQVCHFFYANITSFQLLLCDLLLFGLKLTLVQLQKKKKSFHRL